MADTARCVSGHTRMTLGHTRMRWLVGEGHGAVRMPVRVPIRVLEGDTRMGGSHTRMRERDEDFNVEMPLVVRVWE